MSITCAVAKLTPPDWQNLLVFDGARQLSNCICVDTDKGFAVQVGPSLTKEGAKSLTLIQSKDLRIEAKS